MKKIFVIIFLILAFGNKALAETPHYLDFKLILNQSDAGKKAQKFLKDKLENGINKGGLGKLMTAPILKQKIDNVINHKSITNINNNQIHHTKMNNAYSVTPEQEVVISQSGEDNNKNDNMKRAGTIRGFDDSSQESKKVVIISNDDV